MAEDSWSLCYDEQAQALGVNPQEFEQEYCRRCRNLKCVRAGFNEAAWIQRMKTQEGRLLTSPNIADPDDPRFEEIRSRPFENMLQEAMRLEISERRGDWTIPTAADAEKLAMEVAGVAPAHFVAPPKSDPAVEEPKPEVLWEGTASGSKGRSYRVALTRLGPAEPQWSCTCPSFTLGNPGPEGCKHIREGRAVHETTEVEVPPPPTRSAPPLAVAQPVSGDTIQQLQERRLLPKARNTAFPAEGMMVDGSPVPEPKPEPNPWAIPESKKSGTKKVEVGGSFTFGSPPPTEDKD